MRDHTTCSDTHTQNPGTCDCPPGYCVCPTWELLTQWVLDAIRAGDREEALYWVRERTRLYL